MQETVLATFGGLLCNWRTSLFHFSVAPAADNNTANYRGNDQRHQEHRDQDDEGIQKLVLHR